MYFIEDDKIKEFRVEDIIVADGRKLYSSYDKAKKDLIKALTSEKEQLDEALKEVTSALRAHDE